MIFWRKKPKLPITAEDQKWVEESLTFLKDSIGEKEFLSIKTITPTASFFDYHFDGKEEDAYFVLKRCKELMHIKEDSIRLVFFSDKERLMEDGTTLSTSADIYGRTKGAAGTYRKENGVTTIRLERALLKEPDKMIATISHELAHHKLLGENRIYYNDENLTDLTAIVFGFGIFLGNARFDFQSGIGKGFGWKMSSQGYLPEQVMAYAMASLSLKKKEVHRTYTKYLTRSLQSYFSKSYTYLEKSEQHSFWSIPVVKKSELNEKKEEQPRPQKAVTLSSSEVKDLQQQMIKAVYEGNILALQRILQKQVSPNFNGIGGTPLSIAVTREDKEMIDILLQYRADVNFSEQQSIMDSTPLMNACESGNIAMIRYLIHELKAEINYVAGNGRSPLQVAVENNQLDAVRELLNNGADIEIKSGMGFSYTKTPICFAVEQNNKEMVDFLVKNGAKTKPVRKLPRNEIHRNMVKYLKNRKYL